LCAGVLSIRLATDVAKDGMATGGYGAEYAIARKIRRISHVFELAFEHMVDILNADFRCADVLPIARTHT